MTGVGRVVAAVVVFVLWAGAGCDSQGGSASGETVSSKVLRAEFNAVFTEMTAKADPKGSPVTRGSRILTEMTTRTPGMFQVAASDEARFKSNQFDDAGNRLRLEEAEKALRGKGRVPQLTQYLIEQDRANRLAGVRLELLAHLAERNVRFLSGPTLPPADKH